MKVWLNGSMTDGGEAVISVYDHGFLYGLGLFETFRTYGGEPYLPERHLKRLLSGCAELGIPFGMDASELRDRVRELLAANGLADGYIRLTVSAGDGELGLPLGDYGRPTVLLMAKALPAVSDEALRRGKELRLLRTRRNSPEGAVRLKSLHYMNNIIAKREMLGLLPDAVPQSRPSALLPSPGAEGLMLSREGWLTEGIVSNLFFLCEGVVCTPAIETGILPGVTRARVLELARDAGYEVKEGLYGWEKLLSADEVWLTNSIQELVPVTKLSDWDGLMREVGDGEAGPLTLKLIGMYRADTTSATI
jgi:4-amino-4-deoxychorismate lyase